MSVLIQFVLALMHVAVVVYLVRVGERRHRS